MPGASAQEREDAELRARFEQACRRAAERHENRQAIERIHTRLGELSLEADRLSTPDDHTPESPERDAAWRAVADEWQSLAAQADGLDRDDRRQVCRGRGTSQAARGRQARRRRAHAQAAGAARRPVDRARDGARSRRGSDVARGRSRGPRSEIRAWTRLRP